MNTLQIENAMLSDPVIREHYGGTLAKDELMMVADNKNPRIYIVNNSDSNFPGTHWISLFVNNSRVADCNYFFDSLGNTPLPDFDIFLISHGANKYQYSLSRIQSLKSDTCGLYCLFFAYFSCRGYNLKEILNMFKEDNYLYNELLVLLFYDKMFKT